MTDAADPSDRYLLEQLTWPEVEARLDGDVRTAIVPVGAVEQHGPHLPLGTDAMLGEAIGRRVASRLGDALVAPVVDVGCSSEHAAFPGTVSIPPAVLRDVLEAYVQSLADHGFDYVVLFPTHGGNIDPIRAAAPGLADAASADVIPIADLEWYMDLLNEGLRAGGVDYREPVVHAGATETAAMLAIRRSLVREDACRPGHDGPVSYAELLRDGMGGITESGVLGDPTRATPEAGERVLETVVDGVVDRIRAEIRALEGRPE